MIGYSLTKIAKFGKAFILLRKSEETGKSTLLRIIEALLKAKIVEEIEGPSEQCSHEHLENLSGSKAGAKSTIEKLERLYGKYSRRPKGSTLC